MVKTMVSMVSGEDFPNKTNETSVKNVFFFHGFPSLVALHRQGWYPKLPPAVIFLCEAIIFFGQKKFDPRKQSKKQGKK
jgi:hypothetical protein